MALAENLEVSEIIITTEGTGDDTVGTIVIYAGNSVGAVETTALTDKSRVFTTPERPVPVGVQIIGEQTFNILIEPQGEDLRVDWWLINEEQK